MLSERLLRALNDQVNFEFYSEYSYLAMAAYCETQDMLGFANFFKVQAQEERFHAMKFYDYIYQMDGSVVFNGLEKPQGEFRDVLDVFKHGFEHEKEVTRRIYNLMDIAVDEREHATISLLKWFIDEQVEEESSFNTIIKRLQRVIDSPAALYMLDEELAARTFTPPTAVQ
jgi:ferritin